MNKDLELSRKLSKVLKTKDEVEFKTVSLRKSWKDDKNVWRDSTINLRRSDISKAILVLQKAHEDLLLDGADNE